MRERSVGRFLLDPLDQAGELGGGEGELARVRIPAVPQSDPGTWRKSFQFNADVSFAEPLWELLRH